MHVFGLCTVTAPPDCSRQRDWPAPLTVIPLHAQPQLPSLFVMHAHSAQPPSHVCDFGRDKVV